MVWKTSCLSKMTVFFDKIPRVSEGCVNDVCNFSSSLALNSFTSVLGPRMVMYTQNKHLDINQAQNCWHQEKVEFYMFLFYVLFTERIVIHSHFLSSTAQIAKNSNGKTTGCCRGCEPNHPNHQRTKSPDPQVLTSQEANGQTHMMLRRPQHPMERWDGSDLHSFHFNFVGHSVERRFWKIEIIYKPFCRGRNPSTI